MQEQINNLKNEAIALITQAGSANELEELRRTYLGRKGKINELIENLLK